MDDIIDLNLLFILIGYYTNMTRSATAILLDVLIQRFRDQSTNKSSIDMCIRKMPESKDSVVGRYDSFVISFDHKINDYGHTEEVSILIDPSLRGVRTPSHVVIDLADRDDHGRLTDDSVIQRYSDYNSYPNSTGHERMNNEHFSPDLESDEKLNSFLLDLISEYDKAIFTEKSLFEQNQSLFQSLSR